MLNIQIDELTLNAFVDGQLDADSRRAVLEAMEQDPALREQVAGLRRAKDWMQAGFNTAQPATPARPDKTVSRLGLKYGIAASLVAALIGLTGAFTGYLAGSQQQVAYAENPDQVLLHLDESDPARFQAVLDYAESFLEKHHNSGARVEVIANAGGVDLLRTGTSPYQARIEQMINRYDNLEFIACSNALRNLRAMGVETRLLDEVEQDRTAVDHIVRRLRDGWSYRRVSELPGA